MIKIATRAKAAPRLGGPQGLISWASPESSGARIRPTAVTDWPTPMTVPLAWAPPTLSWRSVMQVLPMVVEKDRRVEDKTTMAMELVVE
ncbi:rCG22226 [Rattus norvegicus]|uniref:RCG22226 n=1 Tax=Rattus norvegicus TaxID=10116 RepID=A6INP6_RAT|nr:rCG22226 [Rattus norvegicus]